MQHIERHFSGSNTVRDVVIGMADGLTVPFALAAGISGALTSSHIVVTAGLAEVAAGSTSEGYDGEQPPKYTVRSGRPPTPGRAR